MREILLTKGYTALVDDADYDWLSQYTWCASESWSRGKMHKVYAVSGIRINGRKTTMRMHRLILGVDEHIVEIDHVDGNGLNNQRANLRVATRGQNASNSGKRKDSKWSKFKGIVFHERSGLWRAYTHKDHEVISLGYYKTEIEAAIAYDLGALMLHGEFARLNFPDGPPQG
jgi:HNH endonuclease